MLIRSTLNGGLADVEPADAATLISGGGWEAVEGNPKPPRRARAAKSVPAPEPKHEE